jgi:RNA polymerase sigma-70 factor (sigma-E family)
VKAAEEDAYREYVIARMDHMRRVAYLMCHNWHTADDVVSITLGKLYRKWRKAQGADNLDSYVRKMFVRTYIDETRRPWRREHSTDQLPELGETMGSVHNETGLMELLRGLPPSKRAVLVLRFYCDMSVEETAQLLKVSSGTVKSQTARGLEALRIMMTVQPGVQR